MCRTSRPFTAKSPAWFEPGGLYRLDWSNPFTQTVDEATWNGTGYLLSLPYENGRELTQLFPHWDVTGPDGDVTQIASPLEFVHSLSAMVNSLVSAWLRHTPRRRGYRQRAGR